MTQVGCYLYALIGSRKAEVFGPFGLGPGGGGHELFSIPYRDIAVCVSEYPGEGLIEATNENCLLHLKAIEALMKRYDLLPFQFGILAPSQESVLRFLKLNYAKIRQTLARLKGKAEVEVQASWEPMEPIFKELLKESRAIARYKEQIAAKPPEATYKDRIVIGEMVAVALDEKKRKEAGPILDVLRRAALGISQRHLSTTPMLLNASLLLRKWDLPRFEKTLERLGKQHEGRIHFRYTGPLPPMSFIRMNLEI